MSEDPRLWSRREFTTFLLVHASYADFEFTESERDAILELVDERALSDVTDYYDRLSEYQRLDHIMQAKEIHIQSEESKQEYLDLLEAHFARDGHTSRPEMTLYNFLSRLL